MVNAKIKIKRALVILTTCGLMFATGCTQARLNDLNDCGRISIGPAFGLDVYLKLGALTQPSLGIASMSIKLGHEDRYLSGIWHEGVGAWPGGLFTPNTFGNFRGEGCNVSGYHNLGPYPGGGDRSYWLPLLSADTVYDPLAFNEFCDLQIGGTLLVVSVRAGINPPEIVDFVVGFFGLDIAEDDHKGNTTYYTPRDD
ncbi:MAG: hypothetical protein HN350_15010 [Phycisphaerales bacterium]|nr:hypothetical protein [Phycisphaerales bacterium]